MNPMVCGLRQPVTLVKRVLAQIWSGIYSVFRMQKDIFPSLDQS